MAGAEPEEVAECPVTVTETLMADRAMGAAEWDVDSAVAALYSEHYRSLVRLAALLVRDIDTAEEVVQDSFVAMHQGWRRLRDNDKALSYLRQSVVNRSRSVLRHRVVVDRNAPKPSPDEPSAEHGAFTLLERAAVVAALRTLPPRQREALVLRYYGDLSDDQIASAMGISKGAVKSHTARAMITLRDVLEDREDKAWQAGSIRDQLRREQRVAVDSIVPSPGALETIRKRTDRHPIPGSAAIRDSGHHQGGGSGRHHPTGGEGHGGGPPGRYLVGEYPGRVRAGTEFSLIVSVVSGAPDPGASAAPMPDMQIGLAGVPVTVVIRPDAALQALGELQQTITVPQHSDSVPARFAIQARAVGLARVRVTAWRGGTFLADLKLEISVEGAVPAADSQRRGAPIGGLQADPGEVTLQVHFDGAQYSFQLLSQQCFFGPVLARSLTERPGQAVERTVAMLRRLAADGAGYSTPLAARWVRETGIGLWQGLVPQLIQDQFWQLQDSITSFTIACDNDAVPWELLYPMAPGMDAGFLAEQFPVLRRVYDQRRSHRIWLGGARYVIPPGSPANAHDEAAAIREILAHPYTSPIEDLESLLDLLDLGAGGMLHFACHNTFAPESGGSSITMSDGKFVPQLLNSAVGQRCLETRSPLIFLNACRSAGAAAEYTQMMSWASQFMAAGAGAFIGTLWPVRSDSASAFAQAFYSNLNHGLSLGSATLAAREATRNDADPTWLAYTVYGDPAAVGAAEA